MAITMYHLSLINHIIQKSIALLDYICLRFSGINIDTDEATSYLIFSVNIQCQLTKWSTDDSCVKVSSKFDKTTSH